MRIDALKTHAGLLSVRVGIHLLVAPELDEEPGAPLRQELAAGRVLALVHEVLIGAAAITLAVSLVRSRRSA